MRDNLPIALNGLAVGTAYAGLSACIFGEICPEAVAYIIASASAIYGVDRILDEKFTPSEADMVFMGTSACVALSVLGSHKETLTVLPLELAVLPLYKPFKKEFPLWKPAYVSTAWMLAVGLVPALLMHKLPDIFALTSLYMQTWAESNRMDCHDVEEDVKDEIFTLPTVIGSEEAALLSDTVSFAGGLIGFLASPSPGHIIIATSGLAPAIKRTTSSFKKPPKAMLRVYSGSYVVKNSTLIRRV
ncbi:UbiA prenyltransferase family protein [Tetraselmis virus 1]|uniref:UbiA prenyltransferase family protein n=1 Tax=Tetraselmis virus 1 TaxID=2060617 RepID=A0A2P0VMX7_9VIRU|nr:UbiA prenyltransferase family protein [Tetraselmis virus 1]AUF82243.1 UbiA prenyltransferase family protein [Tetraselmis virus 1]